MDMLEHMMTTTLNRARVSERTLAACVTACGDCEIACMACCDACLGEPDLANLRRMCRRALDCADVCHATARCAGRIFESDLALLELQLRACARACATCAAECHLHEGDHEHAELCGTAARACEARCQALLAELALQ